MSDSLASYDQSVAYLRERGAYRFNGLWLDCDSNPLAGDPIEAVKALRARSIKAAIRRHQETNRCFTR